MENGGEWWEVGGGRRVEVGERRNGEGREMGDVLMSLKLSFERAV